MKIIYIIFLCIYPYVVSAQNNDAALLKGLEEYKKGKRDYLQMPSLVKAAKKILKDDSLYSAIVNDYKKNYLDKLQATEISTKANLDFIYRYGGSILIDLGDPYFNLAYLQPNLVDTILGIPNISDQWVKGTISEDFVKPILYRNNKPITKTPNWKSVEISVLKAYPLIKEFPRFLLFEKLSFYRSIENWLLYSKLKSKQLQEFPPTRVGMNVFFEVNLPAWDAFLNCDDKEVLKAALKWSELSLKLENQDAQKVQYLDTKANLLYKLGRLSEAIEVERSAITLATSLTFRDVNGKPMFVDEYSETISKMEKKIKTW